jgi:hypothetical protein
MCLPAVGSFKRTSLALTTANNLIGGSALQINGIVCKVHHRLGTAEVEDLV